MQKKTVMGIQEAELIYMHALCAYYAAVERVFKNAFSDGIDYVTYLLYEAIQDESAELYFIFHNVYSML